MIKLFQILQFFIFFFAIYQCISSFVKIPSKKASKLTMSYIAKEGTHKTRDMYLLDIASYLVPYIRLSEYKRERIKSQLKITGTHLTPELHTAFIYTKVCFYILIGSIFLIIPNIGIIIFAICLFLGINTYFVESSRLDVLIRQKRSSIEKELPRLTNTITQELNYTRDIIRILENYMRNAGKEMTEELKITIADMKSGNYEMALTRFETRISSVTLSQVIRGLIGVIRGDDGIFYFQMLSHDLRKLEIQALKTEAVKQPQKIGKYTMFIFLCFLLIIFTALGMSMAEQFTSIF